MQKPVTIRPGICDASCQQHSHRVSAQFPGISANKTAVKAGIEAG
jgi:hypothetical protein